VARTFSVAVLLLLAGCAGQSARWADAGRPAVDVEALAGARAATVLEGRYGGVLHSPVAQRRLEHLGATLVTARPALQRDYHYFLLDSDELNAFSLPGGRLYLTRGLYDSLTTDAQLAGVLAHELAHLENRDHFKSRAVPSTEMLDRELAADARAAEYLRATGVSPMALAEVVQLVANVQPPGWADTRCNQLLRLSLPNGGAAETLAVAP